MVELFEEDGVRGIAALSRPSQNGIRLLDGRRRSLALNRAYRHVVRMPDGSLLNRYWDDRDTPATVWLEDVETAKHSGRRPIESTGICAPGRRPAQGQFFTLATRDAKGRLASAALRPSLSYRFECFSV